MRTFVSRWRYELLALGIALIGAVAHLATNTPVVGIGSVDIDVLHRVVAQLEGRATDYKFRVRGERPSHPGVVVVAIDEKSVHRYGLWPWSRSILAQAIQRMLDAGVKGVGLDVTFTDATHSSPLETPEVLAALDALPNSAPPVLSALRDELHARAAQTPDDALEAALRNGGQTIVQGVIPIPPGAADFGPEMLAKFDRLVEPALFRTVKLASGATLELPIDRLPLWSNLSVQMPLERFALAGTRIGHFSMVPDVDGTIRRMAILGKLTGPKGLVPSMALQTAAQTLGATIEPAWVKSEGDVAGATLKFEDGTSLLLPFEAQSGFMLIDYDGPRSSYPTYSVADVIDGTVGEKELAGKAAIVGVSIVGSSGDQRVTPFKEFEPGMYTHAAVISNILNRRFLTRPWTAPWFEIAALLVACVALGAAISRTRSFTTKAVLAVSGVVAWAVMDAWLFTRGLQVATVVPIATLLASSFGTVFLGYLSVDREKLKMRSTFQRYLGEDVMEVALADPEALNRGEKRVMSVLFSDIRGFTTLSEAMSPESLAEFINQYLSPMTKIVFDEKGTLDKYIGDAVMAFWNAPLTQADHAERACRAAVLMLIKLEELKVKWKAEGYPELEIGIGINTGPMVVGNMGSDVRVDYTVLGDAVNLGARLEGTNKSYDTKIIISESTWQYVKDKMACRRLGAVRVKGKKLPVRIYELRADGVPMGDEARAILATDRALEAYSARRFEEAEAEFREVLSIWPGDYTTTHYLEELEAFKREPPPPDWDGVSTMKTK